MKKPSLLVLAAGMGSRYGSLKQMDGVGPGGEAILDYSVYDAIRAGFGKVVFVIRCSFEEDFRSVFSAERFGGRIEVEYVFQELDRLPDGFTVPEGREKPWGTNHAVMMGAGAIDGPFAVINADDFYGRDSFEVLAGYLTGVSGTGRYCMVAYEVARTLSEHGSVSRGVCGTDAQGNLASLTERTSIERVDGTIYYAEEGERFPLADDTPVSMNMFGFTPDYFEYSQDEFSRFLRERGGELKSEFYIPSMVNSLIASGKASVRVLRTDSEWFGVTYKEDRPAVERRLQALIDAGEYPERLWK